MDCVWIGRQSSPGGYRVVYLDVEIYFLYDIVAFIWTLVLIVSIGVAVPFMDSFRGDMIIVVIKSVVVQSSSVSFLLGIIFSKSILNVLLAIIQYL